ncbi:MAG TPA: oxygen-independent coproporphyrinogen III oxidase [Hyphomonas sp.]|nr:oxygen-independent coproporphyrinogen III oxidase [Hyphomonas sp.]MCA8904557.1 oxygen-independent coproporphyrinogen III oxidase [Hyphomonas sp.]MCB9970116.1 oxygen-independent coproporphyrinogen III oxidase [Hyphomonas sp.]HPE49278.1 oxygen-independent coproporphyrinogen III oxidase [Hyphomonas sp.]
MKQAWKTFATRAVPRYTSYPTAADFTPAVTECDARAWARSVAPGERVSVYIHVPFCEKLCFYCGCATSVPNGYARIANYVAPLHREIDLWAEALAPNHGGIDHLHFGGGSPNALSPDDFKALADHACQAFGMSKDAEIAVEVDPRSMSPEFVDAMAAAGVSRVSFGVQTLAPKVQEAVGRIQPRELLVDGIRRLRAAGIQAVNMDLMYGLPHQTVADVVDAAEFAAEMNASRVSLFGYAHVPWFAKHQSAIDEAALPGLEERFAQAEAGADALVRNGLYAIGLDHFARMDDALTAAARNGTLRRNFQGYTDDPCQTLIGIGATSISQFREGYVQNFKDRRVWQESIENGNLPAERGVVVNDDDRLRARAIEKLMCQLWVDVDAVCREMGASPDALADALETARFLQSAGLCQITGHVITVPAEARLFLRTVAQCFDGRYKPVEARHAKAV